MRAGGRGGRDAAHPRPASAAERVLDATHIRSTCPAPAPPPPPPAPPPPRPPPPPAPPPTDMLEGVRPALDNGTAQLVDHFNAAKWRLDEQGEGADLVRRQGRRCVAGWEGARSARGVQHANEKAAVPALCRRQPCRSLSPPFHSPLST